MITLQDRVLSVLAPEVTHRAQNIPAHATCTAIQAAVSTPDDYLDVALGFAALTPLTPNTPETPMDIASVTKLFTATLALQAIDVGRATFHTPIRTWFPDFGNDATLLHLLNHSSGLPAWDQFYLRLPLLPTAIQAAENKATILDEILQKPLEPAGNNHLYSDLGYILLGHIVERTFDEPLDTLVRQRITEPLGMNLTQYVNQLRGDAPLSAVITENTPGRPQPVRGVVHDENAFIQGGVAGHAGLFSTATDLLKFGEHMLAIAHQQDGIVSAATLQTALAPISRASNGHHVAGWDTPSGDTPSVGRGFSRTQTFGHLGFTGTSLWMDVSARTVAVLLTNRVFPTRENPRIRDLRIRFHEAVLPAQA